MPSSRTPHFPPLLSIDGEEAGHLESVGGGAVSARVIREVPAPSYFVKKHIGEALYEDFTIQVGPPLSPALHLWVADTWLGKRPRRDVSIASFGLNGEVVEGKDFFNARIVEVALPTCDASSKKAGFFTIRARPEYARHRKPTEAKTTGVDATTLKVWSAANFRLDIPGLDCTRVQRIEQAAPAQAAAPGGGTDPGVGSDGSAALDFQDLTVTLTESSAQSWLAWHDDFVIKGNHGDAQERGGTLTLLSLDLKSELARITFFNLGIFRITRAEAASQADSVRLVRAELYCERMELDPVK